MPLSEEMDALWPTHFGLEARSEKPGDVRARAARATLMMYASLIIEEWPQEAERIRHAVVREADREKMLVPYKVPVFPSEPLLVPGEAPVEPGVFSYRIEYRPE